MQEVYFIPIINFLVILKAHNDSSSHLHFYFHYLQGINNNYIYFEGLLMYCFWNFSVN